MTLAPSGGSTKFQTWLSYSVIASQTSWLEAIFQNLGSSLPHDRLWAHLDPQALWFCRQLREIHISWAHDESYWTFMGLVQKMSTQQLVVSLVEFPWKAQWQLVVLELFQEMSYSH